MEALRKRRAELIAADTAMEDLPALSSTEQVADERLQSLKQEFNTSVSLDDMIDYWSALPLVPDTALFQTLTKMPKGALHHIHDAASYDFEKTLEHSKQFPEIQVNTETHAFVANAEPQPGCVTAAEFFDTQMSVAEYANRYCRFSAETQNDGIQQIWRNFDKIFDKILPLANYEPIFDFYTPRLFEEYIAAGYQRIEFRNSPGLYNLNGVLPAKEKARKIKSHIDAVLENHPDVSIAYIPAGYRFLPPDQVELDLLEHYEAAKEYPGVFLGYDLVCEEDTNNPNEIYNEVFYNFEQRTKADGFEFPYYFHAGETILRGKYGVYDALLFNTKRIGHGVAVPKHPAVLQEIKERKICIELNPLSNTQLGYGRDLRCHPGWTFLSHGVPCSISPDDPGIFLNYGGAFDWLWCVICWDLNLAHIKKLCLNSIHGAGNPEDTLRAWEEKWNTFIAELGSDTA